MTKYWCQTCKSCDKIEIFYAISMCIRQKCEVGLCAINPYGSVFLLILQIAGVFIHQTIFKKKKMFLDKVAQQTRFYQLIL